MSGLDKRIGELLWVLCLQFFVIEQVVRAGWQIPYSMRTNFISDLGAVGCGVPWALVRVCSPLHAWMNASFVLQGVLIFCGAWLVRGLFPQSPGWTGAFRMLALSGAGVLIVGMAPEDVNAGAHRAGAALHFLCGNGGIVLFGWMLLRSGRRLTAVLTLALGTLGLVGTVMVGRGIDLGLGMGTVERVAAYPLPVWLVLAGCTLLFSERSAAVLLNDAGDEGTLRGAGTL